MKPPSALQLAGILIVGVIAISSGSVLIRLAQWAGAQAATITAVRLAVAAAALASPALHKHMIPNYATLKPVQWSLLLLSGICLCLHFYCWILSLERTVVLSSVVLVNTSPVWVGLTVPFFLRERVRRGTWLGMLLALGGIALTAAAVPANEAASAEALPGVLLAVLGAMFYAGYLMIGRRLREQVPFSAYVFTVYLCAALCAAALTLTNDLSWANLPASAWLWMVLVALIPQLIGHTSLNFAVRYISAAQVSTLALGEVVGAGLLAWLVFQEVPSNAAAAGAVLVMGGILVSSWVGRGESEVPAAQS